MERADSYPLIWTDETMHPHQPGKTRLSPKCRNQWRGWATRARINESPAIRGARSLLRRDRLAICAVFGSRDGSIMARPWCYVMLSKDASRLCLWNIILSMMACENRLADPDTILVFSTYFGVFGDGTRLAMPKTICTPELRH